MPTLRDALPVDKRDQRGAEDGGEPGKQTVADGQEGILGRRLENFLLPEVITRTPSFSM